MTTTIKVPLHDYQSLSDYMAMALQRAIVRDFEKRVVLVDDDIKQTTIAALKRRGLVEYEYINLYWLPRVTERGIHVALRTMMELTYDRQFRMYKLRCTHPTHKDFKAQTGTLWRTVLELNLLDDNRSYMAVRPLGLTNPDDAVLALFSEAYALFSYLVEYREPQFLPPAFFMEDGNGNFENPVWSIHTP